MCFTVCFRVQMKISLYRGASSQNQRLLTGQEKSLFLEGAHNLFYDKSCNSVHFAEKKNELK